MATKKEKTKSKTTKEKVKTSVEETPVVETTQVIEEPKKTAWEIRLENLKNANKNL